MKITFYGAVGEVTGSKTLIQTGDKNFLLDCGLFHGEHEKNNEEPFPFPVESITAVILTHAHLDHVGLLPKLVKDGFNGPIYATEPTRRIAKLMLEDAAKVQTEETEGSGQRLYDLFDVEKAYGLIQGIDYNEWLHLPAQVKIRFRDAGHVLGSAFVEFQAEGLTLIGSGDIGNDDVPIIKNTDALEKANIVILESTYGARVHKSARDRVALLKQAIADVIDRRGVLIIPAFSLERTQEILYEINGLVERGEIRELPVFLDGPLAIDLLPIYRRFSELYDKEAMFLRSAGDDFFRFSGLQITRQAYESFHIDKVSPPKIIIAGSGMMSGGRVTRHLVRYLPGENNLVLVVGYQAVGTRGRQLIEGAKVVDIQGVPVTVNAQIREIDAYSAHGDQTKLLRWLGTAQQPPRTVFLNHGEKDQAEVLAEIISRQGLAEQVIVSEQGLTYSV
jgi:metallo-beta-lactamase family protein